MEIKMIKKQIIKNAIDMITGKTTSDAAAILNEKFQLVANRASGYAILYFRGGMMDYLENLHTFEQRGAERTPLLGTQDFTAYDAPTPIKKSYQYAEAEKDAVEKIGLTDVFVGYTNSATVSTNNGPQKVQHRLFLTFPIDKNHKKNIIIAKAMARIDPTTNLYYRGR
jgi:hypothetical protein